MPLIEFPNVPIAIGVPDVRRLAEVAINRAVSTVIARSGILEVLSIADGFGLGLQEDIASQWQILDQSGAPIVTPDSVLSFEYRNEQRLSTHPVEEGAFATYNKIATPYDARLRMTCGGQGVMSRDQFLSRLSDMLNSIELCTIVTPDAVYDSMNLDHMDYRRESRSGATLLTVDAWFTEVRVTAMKSFISTAQPSGSASVNGGTVQPSPPSAEVQAALGAAGVQ